jgi:hypothetical protein
LEEEAEELPVVIAEAAEESGVGEDAAPGLASVGGAAEGGWLRRETEEYLLEKVLDLQRGCRHRQRMAADPSFTCILIDGCISELLLKSQDPDRAEWRERDSPGSITCLLNQSTKIHAPAWFIGQEEDQDSRN